MKLLVKKGVLPMNGHIVPPYLTTNLEGRFVSGKPEKFCVDSTPCVASLARLAGRIRGAARATTVNATADEPANAEVYPPEAAPEATRATAGRRR